MKPRQVNIKSATESKQYDPDANVYVASLPRNYNKDKLYQLFSKYGTVLRYKYVSPKDETKCPYGFVQFFHPICAQQAIKGLNGYVIGDSNSNESIEVSIAAVGRRTLFKSEEPTNLYIENMPSIWNNDILSSVFGKYGNIIQSKITGNNVAFVRFETHEQALNAINHLHRNNNMSVRFATCQHKENKKVIDNNNNNNLYIKNLPSTYNQLDLERLFSQFGSISSATIINDSIGVAFVRYRFSENAKKAIKKLNGTKPLKFDKEIVVKYAHSDINIHKNKNKNNYIICGYVRNSILFDIKNISNIIYLYFNDNNDGNNNNNNNNKNNKKTLEFNDNCFDDILLRINIFDDTLEVMQNNIYGINNKINSLLLESEQKRIYEMSTIQQQFTDIINKLYNNINNRISCVSARLRKTVETENLRIESLEKQIYKIYNNNVLKINDDDQTNNSMYNNTNELNKIRIWLKDTVHLEQYYNVLIQNGYDDMESIADINDYDLSFLDMKIGHKKKLLKYAKKLNHMHISSQNIYI